MEICTGSSTGECAQKTQGCRPAGFCHWRTECRACACSNTAAPLQPYLDLSYSLSMDCFEKPIISLVSCLTNRWRKAAQGRCWKCFAIAKAHTLHLLRQS